MSEKITRNPVAAVASAEAAADNANAAANEAAAIAASAKADATAARDAALIEKASKVGAKISNADARRIARILRDLTDEAFGVYVTAAKGRRSPLATAVRVEVSRRAAPKAAPAPKAEKADKPARVATPKAPKAPVADSATIDRIVRMWNEPTTANADKRRAEIAEATGLWRKIAGILRNAGIDPTVIPNPAPKAEKPRAEKAPETTTPTAEEAASE